MNPAKARPRPIVRLPPPGPTHASQPVRLEDPSSSSRPHSDPLANGNPAWQDFFKTLMADRDSTATKPTEIPTVGPTIIDFTNGSIPDDAASSGTTEAQGQDTEVNRTGKKKRRRHKAGKKKREANAHSEIDGEALQSPSLKALAPTVSPSSAALLLQNARNNWVNVCHLLMSEVSPDDREVLKQITYFISRLGTIPDHATTETQSASLGTKESPTTQNSSESPLDGEMNPEHGTAASPPEVQATVGATHPYSESEHLALAQETEDERQARLERIASRLLLRRQEQPVEYRLGSQDMATLASRGSDRAQQDEHFHERMNGCIKASNVEAEDEDSSPKG